MESRRLSLKGAASAGRLALARRGSLAALCLMLGSQTAFAYRPFDGTDADVAGPREFDLELQPLGALQQGDEKWWVAPAVVANFGLEGRRELVVQGQGQFLREGLAEAPSFSLVDTGVFIKQVLRPGGLQDETGPSVATEYGFLLPEIHAQSGTGFAWAGIVSERWPAATVHLNAAASLTRDHEPDGFLGVILEGPYRWALRPVAEFTLEQASGSPRAESGLVGAIWRFSDSLSFDTGFRRAHAGSEATRELRAGLTWIYSTK